MLDLLSTIVLVLITYKVIYKCACKRKLNKLKIIPESNKQKLTSFLKDRTKEEIVGKSEKKEETYGKSKTSKEIAVEHVKKEEIIAKYMKKEGKEDELIKKQIDDKIKDKKEKDDIPQKQEVINNESKQKEVIYDTYEKKEEPANKLKKAEEKDDKSKKSEETSSKLKKAEETNKQPKKKEETNDIHKKDDESKKVEKTDDKYKNESKKNEDDKLKKNEKITDKLIKKNKIEQYFNLKELKKIIEDYNKKETILYFHCETLVSKYYSKIYIFNEEYDLKENETIKIKVKKFELINSDFTEKIILKSEKGKIDFIINISYNMNNHYQIILDKIDIPLSLEFVLYSKDNKFPKNPSGDKFILKDYEDNSIPFLKKFNLINISQKDFYQIYNTYSSKKLDNKKKYDFNKEKSLFVNFIIKNDNEIEGRIFKQEEELEYQEFTKEEIELLKEIKKLTLNFSKDKYEILKKLREFLVYSYKTIVKSKENIIKRILEKFFGTCFFNKYYGKKINKEIFDLIDVVIFIFYLEKSGPPGINTFVKYLEKKNFILSDENEFNDFEKLMLLINIQYLVDHYADFKFVRFSDLETNSPFIESEKLFFDIIKGLNENLALYFFYLQINSSSGSDYISLDSWFKIKFIPITKIKSHLLFTRHPFFFTFNEADKANSRAAFVNPYNLIINFNVHTKVGYNYVDDLLIEVDDDNMIKILFLKFHESAHSKFDCSARFVPSPRYFLNNDLEKSDSHYDSIAEYKEGKKLNESEKKGINIGEEGYAMEMYLYGSVFKTDLVLKKLYGLKIFNNVNLYVGNNFKELNDIFKDLIKSQIPYEEFNNMEKQFENIKARNLKTINLNLNQDKEVIKTPIYFFNNYPIEANY